MKKFYVAIVAIAALILVGLYYPTEQRILDSKIKEYEKKLETLSGQIEKTRFDRINAEKDWKEKDNTMSGQINDMKQDIDKLQKCIQVKTLDCQGTEKKALISFLSNSVYAADWTVTPASSGVPEHTLRKVLMIPECETRELNFNTKHKFPARGIEWLAYDIPPCEKWVAMDVYVPDYWEDWIIEKVWVWVNMWNFIVIKDVSSDIRVAFWHTETHLKEWDRVKKTWIIGKTNLSWTSTWMHLHVEIWKWSNIVSKHVFWSTDFTSTPEPELLQYRNWNFTDDQKNEILAFVKSYECKNGPQLTAYWDYTGYSIGCWTPSHEGETITEEEAYRRIDMWMQSVKIAVKKDFWDLSQNQLIALSSLMMNNWTCYKHFKTNGVDETIWRTKCDLASGDRLRWLTIRRNAEADLYFWKK